MNASFHSHALKVDWIRLISSLKGKRPTYQSGIINMYNEWYDAKPSLDVFLFIDVLTLSQVEAKWSKDVRFSSVLGKGVPFEFHYR